MCMLLCWMSVIMSWKELCGKLFGCRIRVLSVGYGRNIFFVAYYVCMVLVN
jgi:hypothetical protein